MNSKQGIGIGLIVVAIVFLLEIIRIPYCFGQTVSTHSFWFIQGTSYCVGFAVNLGAYLGWALLIIGAVLLYQGHSEEE